MIHGFQFDSTIDFLPHVLRIRIFFHINIYTIIHISKDMCIYIYIYNIVFLLARDSTIFQNVPFFNKSSAKYYPQSPVSELHQLLMAVSNGDRIKLGDSAVEILMGETC